MPDTEDMDRKELREWLKRGLAKKDRVRTATELAKKLGIHRTAISKIISGERGIKASELRIIADYINEPIPMDADDDIVQPMPDDKLAVYIGNVAAGAWIDMETQAIIKSEEIVAVPTQFYEKLPQGYLNIMDDSCNLFAKKGETIWVVDYDKVRKVPQHNDFVVIKMSHPLNNHNGKKQLYEWTVRKVIRSGTSVILEGLSSIPGLMNDLEYDENSLDLEIAYLVIFKGQYLNY